MQGGDSYIDKAFENDIAHRARVVTLENPDAIRAIFPTGLNLSLPHDARGFLNYDGGWAFASQGIERMMYKVSALGGKIIPGKTVAELLRNNGDGTVTGIRCTDESVLYANIIVLAAGSWTASAFPDLGLDGQCLATG